MTRLKNLGAALLVVAALGAVLASSALAAAVTQDVRWYTGTSPGTELVGSETLGAEAVGNWTFQVHLAGVERELEWTGVNCVGCKIENTGGSAIGSGELEFTGVTVKKPSGCTATSTVKTKPLSIQADWMKGANEEPNYWELTPTAGVTTVFVQFTITGPVPCTTLVAKGNVFFRTANATNTQAVGQEVDSSGAINAAAGGNLHIGEESAVLTGNAKFKMNGAKVGVAFGTH